MQLSELRQVAHASQEFARVPRPCFPPFGKQGGAVDRSFIGRCPWFTRVPCASIWVRQPEVRESQPVRAEGESPGRKCGLKCSTTHRAEHDAHFATRANPW